MFKSTSQLVLAFILSALTIAGCQNSEPESQDKRAYASIDSALAHIQPQTDTGYQPYTRYKKSLDSLEKVAKGHNYHNALSRIYFMVGSMSRWEGSYDTSLVWLRKSYNEVKGTNTLEEINTLLEIGDVYLSIGRKKLANEYYYNAMFIGEKINSTEATAKTFYRLASVFYHQSSFREALKMYRKTLIFNRITRYLGDHKTLEMRMLNNIGVCYYKLKEYDSALMYYDSALLEAYRLNPAPNTIAKGVFMGNKGRIYQLQGDYKQAIPLLTLNTKINARPKGDKRDAITSFMYLGEIYNSLDSTAKFESITDSAIKYSYIVKSSDVLVWRANLFGLKADYYARKGDNELAYSFRTQQFILRDSIDRAEEKEETKDIVLYRELKLNENELLSLRESSKAQETRLFIYLTLAILALALLIITTLGLNKYRQNLILQKKLNAKIREQNQIINLKKTEHEQANEELKRLNTEKNRLLGMVAHDLRGPIYNITGVVQLLESSEHYSNAEESDSQLIDLIKKSCENALTVINDLLDAAKLENSGIANEIRTESLNDLLADSMKLYQSWAIQKNITIKLTKPRQVIEAEISKEKINRAIGNLLSNAIKFSHKDTFVVLTLTKAENKAIISISDSGIGIPQADREIIFEQFTKAKRPGTDGEKPVGLGMSIVKQIVEAHQGSIWLESEVGKGTTFYIELPLG